MADVAATSGACSNSSANWQRPWSGNGFGEDWGFRGSTPMVSGRSQKSGAQPSYTIWEIRERRG